MQARRKWRHTFWTVKTAIKNHHNLAAEFDKVKNYKGKLPNFYAIPWPVLISPTILLPEDITWEAVEAFLAELKKTMEENEYKAYINATQKRFHTNRWDARAIWNEDHPVRTKLLRTANMAVIQAVNPVYDAYFRAEPVMEYAY